MMSLGFCIHPSIWHVCKSLLKFMGVYVWLGAVSGVNCWIMEQLWQEFSGFCFSTNDIVLCCIHFSSWQDCWKVKLQLVPSGNFWSVFLVLCLFFTCGLICSLIENTVTIPLLSSFVSLLKVIFFKCSQGWLGVQLAPPCRNSCRNSPQILCSHKSGEVEAMLLLCPCQTIVPVIALGGKWQHPEKS